jgi:hypothetical protein
LEAEELGKDVPEDVDMSVYMGDVIVLDVWEVIILIWIIVAFIC